MNNPLIIVICLFVIIILFSPIPWSLINKLIKKITASFRRRTLDEEKISVIQDISIAVEALAEFGKGATIIIDQKKEVYNYIVDSEQLDAQISSNLITTIFEGSKTPLHDGAIVIRGSRIEQASAYITKLSKQKLPKKFGTRHRSGLGISEATSAIVIVLSEERQKVTIFYKGDWEELAPKDLFDRLVRTWIN